MAALTHPNPQNTGEKPNAVPTVRLQTNMSVATDDQRRQCACRSSRYRRSANLARVGGESQALPKSTKPTGAVTTSH